MIDIEHIITEVASSLVYIHCPYCGVDNQQIWAQENGYQAVKCENCKFVYVNPRPPLEKIVEASRLGLHKTMFGDLNFVGHFRRSKVKRFKKRLFQLYSHSEIVERKISWLDIGTGFGEFLIALGESTDGKSVIKGIEPCRPKLEVAKRKGLSVMSSSLSEIDSKFYYISLINVFSHLPDPRDFISSLKPLLESNGEILLVTGNAGDILVDHYPGSLNLPDHLVFAGEVHIKGLLEYSGFEIIKQKKFDQFLPMNRYMYWLKRIGKKIFLHQAFSNSSQSEFRSMWFRARLLD